MKLSKPLVVETGGILLAALVAMLCGFIVILITSTEPLTAAGAMFLDPVSTPFNLGMILNKATPLILTGLAFSVVFKTGVFSIGAEGQLYAGGFLGVLCGAYISDLTPWLHFPLVLVCAILGGALYGLIPGLLKVFFRANEIVTTLMLNSVAILGASYLVNYPFRVEGGGFAHTEYVKNEILLAKIMPGTSAHAGIIIAVVAVVAIYLLFYKTPIGYELRLVGENPQFSKYGGIVTRKVVLVSFLISGGLAGLAGIVEILGIQKTFSDSFSSGFGFDGIVIALMARNHPVGVLIAALFYGYIQVGAQTIQMGSDMPREIAVIIQVMLVLLVSAQAIFKYMQQKYAANAPAVAKSL